MSAYAVPPTEVAARLDRLPVSRWHLKVTALIGIATFFDIYELLMSGVLGSVLSEEWDLGRTTKALLIGAPYYGMVLGAIGLGAIADRYGRRRMLMVNLAGYALLSLAAAFATDVSTLIVLRMAAGIFMGAELPLVDTYMSELMPRASRGRLTAIAYTIGFCGAPVTGLLGGLLVAKTHVLIDGWRWLLVFGAVGALTTWILRLGLPESPRWLAAQGRHAEAESITRDIEQTVQRQHGKPLPDPGADAPRGPQRPVALRDMFRGTLRNRTIMLWIFHPLQTLGYYGFASLVPLILVSKGFSVTESLWYTTLVYLGYPAGSALSLLVVERFERKYLIITTLATATLLGFVFGTATTPWLIATSGVGISLVNNVFSNAYHVYQAELFPTSIRSRAIGIPYSLSRVTSALLPFGALALLDSFGALGIFTGSGIAMAVVCITVATLGPKTTGRSLENVEDTADAPVPAPVKT
ncbi:MFS transporter [Streptomyces antnestii]|uniref:MFS transporter n=1 Tax=Streptomyces antnestii TaxID=2494256 RepID=A0A437PKQ1_9ACTN|nr:MFS transporter [Streptomyces sp. San01]RVU22855.1 MFS transporter [Streptomyces sp. San01]